MKFAKAGILYIDTYITIEATDATHGLRSKARGRHKTSVAAATALDSLRSTRQFVDLYVEGSDRVRRLKG